MLFVESGQTVVGPLLIVHAGGKAKQQLGAAPATVAVQCVGFSGSGHGPAVFIAILALCGVPKG